MAFVFIYQYSRARARQPYPVSARKFRIRTTRHKQARSLAVSDMATSATPTLSMKLLIDGKAQRVLFAEASKEVVDFLFSLLALPVATAVKLVGKEAMVGCVGNLYASVEKLDSTYVQPGAAKASLLSPTVLSPAASAVLRLPARSSPVQPKTWYRCTNNTPTIVATAATTSPTHAARRARSVAARCQRLRSACRRRGPAPAGQQVAVQSAAKGFVQGIVTYTVLDNLTVTPMSAISSITLLNTFAVRDIGDLQEKTVQLGYNEGLAILKASLQSKSVLTNVFLPGGGKKATTPGGRS